jgi:hypothetical protein
MAPSAASPAPTPEPHSGTDRGGLRSDLAPVVEQLGRLLRAERQLLAQMEITRRAVANLLATLSLNRVPRIAVARRVAGDLGYGTSVGDLLAAVDALRKRLARARRRPRRQRLPPSPKPGP